MSLQRDKISELRERRSDILEDQKRQAFRDSYGEKFAVALTEATGLPLAVENFDPKQLIPFKWPEDIRDAEGLVAAYITKAMAVELLNCFDKTLGLVEGKLGFHDKCYLGAAQLSAVRVDTLIAAAEKTEDAVMLYLAQPSGTILVDYYKAPLSEPFSVVVQGDSLVRVLAPCFVHLR